MRTFRGHRGFVQSLAFSPVGSLVASGASDGRVIVWDPLTGGIVYEAGVDGTDGENVGAVAFSPDGSFLASGSHEGNVRVFCPAKGPVPILNFTEQGRITALAFSPDGKRLAWSSYPGWSAHSLHDSAIIALERHNVSGLLFILRIAPDGQTVAVAGTGPDILLYDLYDTKAPATPTKLTHGDRQGVWSLAYSPDGRSLAAALAGGVQLWDLTANRLLDEWKDHDDVVTGIAISPDGSRLLTCSWDRTTRLYVFDPVTQSRGPLVGCYDWKVGRLFDVAISPDSTLAVAGGDDGDYVVAWDIE